MLKKTADLADDGTPNWQLSSLRGDLAFFCLCNKEHKEAMDHIPPDPGERVLGIKVLVLVVRPWHDERASRQREQDQDARMEPCIQSEEVAWQFLTLLLPQEHILSHILTSG